MPIENLQQRNLVLSQEVRMATVLPISLLSCPLHTMIEYQLKSDWIFFLVPTLK